MTTLLANALEIQEVMDEDDDICERLLDKLTAEEKTPIWIVESVSALISDLDQMDLSEWFYTVEEEQAPSSMTVEDSSFAEKREQLCELFSRRLEEGRWTDLASMPRKGRDSQFDDLLHQLGLAENRQYASSQWRKFKKDKDVFPPLSFEADPEKLMIDYRRRIEKYTVEKVVAEALAAITAVKCQPQTISAEAREHFLLFALSKAVEIKLSEFLWMMTEVLASKIAGATNGSIVDKTTGVDVYLLLTSSRAFNAFARDKVDVTAFPVKSANLFLVGCMTTL
jgi:hypothetical protein